MKRAMSSFEIQQSVSESASIVNDSSQPAVHDDDDDDDDNDCVTIKSGANGDVVFTGSEKVGPSM